MRRHTGAIVAVLLIGVTLQHSTPFVEAADAPAVSPVPKFATQRWGQALHHMASMVGVAWGNERLVSPPGDLTMSNMWPVKADATQLLLNSNVPWQDVEIVGVRGTTSGWLGALFGECVAPTTPTQSACVLNELLAFLHARHDNHTFPWVLQTNRSQWLTNFGAGMYSPRSSDGLYHIRQFGGILNSSGALEYTFEDSITFSSIARVDALPNASWFNEGAIYAFRDAMCPGSGNKTAEDAFFGPSGMLNSLTTGFVVVTNLTVDSRIMEASGYVLNSTSTSTAPSAPFIAALIQRKLPFRAPCRNATASTSPEHEARDNQGPQDKTSVVPTPRADFGSLLRGMRP